jgi:hypothetical protein
MARSTSPSLNTIHARWDIASVWRSFKYGHVVLEGLAHLPVVEVAVREPQPDRHHVGVGGDDLLHLLVGHLRQVTALPGDRFVAGQLRITPEDLPVLEE